MKRRLNWFIGMFFVTCCVGCGRDPERVQEGHIDSRAVSPDGIVEAVVMLPKLDGFGATISQPYQVFLRSLRPGVKKELVVFEADKTDGLHIRWRGAQLVICYSDAQILWFRNRFDTFGQDSLNVSEIEVILNKVTKLEDC